MTIILIRNVDFTLTLGTKQIIPTELKVLLSKVSPTKSFKNSHNLPRDGKVPYLTMNDISNHWGLYSVFRRLQRGIS